MTTKVTSPPTADILAAAFDKHLPAFKKLTEEELLSRINFDVASAVSIVLGAVPALLGLRSELVELPDMKPAYVDELQSVAYAALHAHMQALAAPDAVSDLPALTERARLARKKLHADAVSAIGHEGDAPLLDLVADYRASTPTDAARRVVPDFREELSGVSHLHTRLVAATSRVLAREAESLNLLTSRPILQKPTAALEQQASSLEQAMLRMRGVVSRTLSAQQAEVAQLQAMLNTLSPTATLARGYSILRTPSKTILRTTGEIKAGSLIEGMLSEGTFVANIVGVNPKGSFVTDPQPSQSSTEGESR